MYGFVHQTVLAGFSMHILLYYLLYVFIIHICLILVLFPVLPPQMTAAEL